MTPGERKANLFLQHPQDSPAIIGRLPYLIHPPSTLASDATWIAFRERTLLPAIEHRPDDANLPMFLEQVERVLTWRATVPPEDRFWRNDKE